MKIPFVGQSSTVRSTTADAQRSLNCYVEMDNNSPRAPVALYGTPGMVSIGTVGAGPHRGSIALGDYGILVSGSHVYSAVYNGPGYTVTDLGTLTTSTGTVGLAYNGVQVLIVDGVKGWLATLSTLTEIVDVDFPNGVTSAAAMDSFFIVCGDGTHQLHWNQTALDGSAWNALDFATAEAAPDALLGCVADNRNLWLFGSASTEPWEFTGNNDQPFERSSSAFIQIGTVSAASCRALDNTVFWLGRDTNGSGIVYKAQGYSPVRISTSAIEFAIQGYSTIDDATALTYQQEGHSFYVLTFPTQGKTWAYDASTNEWHERCYRNPSTGAEERWRANCHVFFAKKNIVGDYANGNLYQLDLNTYTDNGQPIKRLRATQCMENEQKLLFFPMMQVDLEVGSGSGTLSMRYSDDGGHTWSSLRTVTLTNGTYNTRAIFRRLGKGRNRVFEISTTSNMKWAILGAEAQVEKGMN